MARAPRYHDLVPMTDKERAWLYAQTRRGTGYGAYGASRTLSWDGYWRKQRAAGLHSTALGQSDGHLVCTCWLITGRDPASAPGHRDLVGGTEVVTRSVLAAVRFGGEGATFVCRPCGVRVRYPTPEQAHEALATHACSAATG